MLEASRQGADVIELGVPFSDPLADGPVIQRATQRALAAGVTLPRVLEMVRELRGDLSTPVVFMIYYNPILAFGLKAFCRTAAEAGVDGVLVIDLPPEEAGPLHAEADPLGLDVVHFVAPTTPAARMRAIARVSRGFIYLVSLTGVTGERASLPPDLTSLLRTLRGVTTKPVCVGFGISTRRAGRPRGRARRRRDRGLRHRAAHRAPRWLDGPRCRGRALPRRPQGSPRGPRALLAERGEGGVRG